MKYVLFLPLISSLLTSCYTTDEGELRPLVSNPEVVVAAAVTNEITGKNTRALLKVTIQDRNCMRPYPLSQLKLTLQAVHPDVQGSLKSITIYPPKQEFQKEVNVEANSKYAIKLVYEPSAKVLFEATEFIRETHDLNVAIACPEGAGKE